MIVTNTRKAVKLIDDREYIAPFFQEHLVVRYTSHRLACPTLLLQEGGKELQELGFIHTQNRLHLLRLLRVRHKDLRRTLCLLRTLNTLKASY